MTSVGDLGQDGAEAAAGTTRGDLRISIEAGEVPEYVDFSFKALAGGAAVQLIEAGGEMLPTPIDATRVSQTRDGLLARFPGWQIARYVRTDPKAPVRTPLGFVIRGSDGSKRRGEAAITVAGGTSEK